MPNSTRQEILRYWKQADKDLDRFLMNANNLLEIFDQANKEYAGRYDLFFGSILGIIQIIIKTQKAWRKLRNEKL